MNFAERVEDPKMLVELKYCERCGGLWLRAQGADGVYCASCSVRLAEMPNTNATVKAVRSRRARMPVAGQECVQKDSQHPGLIENLQGVAAMEVRA